MRNGPLTCVSEAKDLGVILTLGFQPSRPCEAVANNVGGVLTNIGTAASKKQMDAFVDAHCTCKSYLRGQHAISDPKLM